MVVEKTCFQAVLPKPIHCRNGSQKYGNGVIDGQAILVAPTIQIRRESAFSTNLESPVESVLPYESAQVLLVNAAGSHKDLEPLYFKQMVVNFATQGPIIYAGLVNGGAGATPSDQLFLCWGSAQL
jgi:hypothetical protein